jgi:photosystem II stability/assembly factor-like uncharacterized protein
MKKIKSIIYFVVFYYNVNAQTGNCPWNLTLSDSLRTLQQNNCVQGDWIELNSGTTERLVDVCVVNACNVFAVGYNNTILRSTNNGKTWVPFNYSGLSPTTLLMDIKFVNDTLGFLIGYNNSVLKTTDGGSSWTNIAPSTINPNRRWLNLWLFDNDNIIVVGDDNTATSPLLAITQNGGATWSFIQTNALSTIYGIFFTNNNTGFISTNFGNILKTTDGGLTWQTKLNQAQDNSSPQLLSIYFTTPNDGFAVGGRNPTDGNSGGKIYQTSDGGETWNTYNSYTPIYYRSVEFENELTGYIAGGHIANNTSTILKTVDGGNTWILESSNSKRLSKQSIKNINSQFVVGLDGTILKLCHGNNIRLQANGAESYHWSNGSTNDIIEVSPTETTTYTISGTKSGCSQSKTITVNVPTLAADVQTICFGQSTSILAGGFNAYNWSPPTDLNTVTGATVVATPSVTTTYTVSDISSCPAQTQTITISVNDQPNYTIAPDVITKSNVQYPIIVFTGSNGSPPYIFYYTVNDGPIQSISTQSDKDTVSLLVPANSPTTWVYKTISVEDVNGCTQNQTDSIVFKVNPPLAISDLSKQEKATIFPNPVQSLLNLQVYSPASVAIKDITGREVYAGNINTGTSVVNVSQLSSGIYFVVIKNNSGVTTQKIIKE